MYPANVKVPLPYINSNVQEMDQNVSLITEIAPNY